MILTKLTIPSPPAISDSAENWQTTTGAMHPTQSHHAAAHLLLPSPLGERVWGEVVRFRLLIAGSPPITAYPLPSRQFPRLPIRARQQCGRFLVVDDLFFLGVPLVLSSSHHCDQPKMTGN